jgi:3-isopropylmalate/(R)-2-methylmalate dehydratase small subunit
MSEQSNLIFTGRVWKFGDLINTDLIMPSKAFRLPKKEQHTLCFEAVRPEFARDVKAGDIIVAGENFGMGSSRPIGEVMRSAGIAAVVAESINGLAMRTCVNSSLPAINCLGVAALFSDGDTARVDFLSGRIENLTTGKSLQTHPMAPLLAEIVAAGGVVPMLLKDGYIHAEPFIASSS